MILNHLLYVMKTIMSATLYGFIYQKSVYHCISNRLTLHTESNYTIFLDLSAHFDITNRHVILCELDKMGIGLDLLFLSNRKSSVLFQRYKSEMKLLELGTLQGGVLTPTLFSVLSNALPEFLPNNTKHHMLTYTDDTLINTSGYDDTLSRLNNVPDICERLRLFISTERTKILDRHPPKRDGVTRMIHLNNGTLVECIRRYRYLSLEV